MFRILSRRARARARRTGVIAITEPHARAHVERVGLTAADLGELASWAAVCAPAAERAAAALLAHVGRDRTTQARSAPSALLLRLRPAAERHVRMLLDARLDDEAAAERRQIGELLFALGLDPSAFVAAHEAVRAVLVDAVVRGGASRAEQAAFTGALGRRVLLDVALVLSALVRALDARLAAALADARRARGERAAALAGQALHDRVAPPPHDPPSAGTFRPERRRSVHLPN